MIAAACLADICLLVAIYSIYIRLPYVVSLHVPGIPSVRGANMGRFNKRFAFWASTNIGGELPRAVEEEPQDGPYTNLVGSASMII